MRALGTLFAKAIQAAVMMQMDHVHQRLLLAEL